MASVSVDEIDRSLVVHLDTDVLREMGGSMTNAEDRAVEGPHYFLILEVDSASRNCLAVPPFSKPAQGSEKLDRNLKRGESNKWANVDSYFSKWQHWRIPLDAIPAASRDEESARSNRRRYAADSLKTLQEIADWQKQNHHLFRTLVETVRTVDVPHAAGGLTDKEKERRRQALVQAKR